MDTQETQVSTSAPAVDTAVATQPGGTDGKGSPDGGVGLAQLRAAHDTLKKEFEPFQKLNLKPDQIQQLQQRDSVYQKLYTESAKLAKQLGYADAEVAEALLADPVATLDFLRREAAGQRPARGDGSEDLSKRIEEAVNQAVEPLNERENARATSEANALFERTARQLAVEMFKQEGVPIDQVGEDEMGLLLNAAAEIMKYDEGALRSLKYEGKTASVQQAFQEAKTMLDKYFVARSGRSAKVAPPAKPGVSANAQGKKPTLDELISDPGLIGDKYKEK